MLKTVAFNYLLKYREQQATDKKRLKKWEEFVKNA